MEKQKDYLISLGDKKLALENEIELFEMDVSPRDALWYTKPLLLALARVEMEIERILYFIEED